MNENVECIPEVKAEYENMKTNPALRFYNGYMNLKNEKYIKKKERIDMAIRNEPDYVPVPAPVVGEKRSFEQMTALAVDSDAVTPPEPSPSPEMIPKRAAPVETETPAETPVVKLATPSKPSASFTTFSSPFRVIPSAKPFNVDDFKGSERAAALAAIRAASFSQRLSPLSTPGGGK
jgi:hypothetical protein